MLPCFRVLPVCVLPCRVAAAQAARCSPSVLHFSVPVVTGCRNLVG
uniref:Uncharacterized protein n=1 Tax=Fagus sylvatica TaxID=28930 RepID=A0A2N9EKY5_FAGSY